MLQLVEEGHTEPTAPQVAALAGVAERTVFRHFSDMGCLFRELSMRVNARVQSLEKEEITGGNWDDQLRQLVEKRVRVYEEILPFLHFTQARRDRSEVIRKDVRHIVARMRQRLDSILPEEISSDRARFEAIDVLLSFEVWIRLRRDQRLSARRATQVIHRAISAMTGSESPNS